MVASIVSSVRAAGRRAWPELELDDDCVARFIQTLAAPESIAEARHADLYLVAGCLENNTRALALFDIEMSGVIDRALAKLGAAADVVDEVRQAVRELALVAKPGRRPAIATYNGSGQLGSWVRIVALREAYRVLASRGRDPGGDERLAEVLAPAADPELALMKDHFRAAFGRAFTTAMEALGKRHRTTLRLSVLDGLTIDEIAPMFDVHRATVARWLASAREELLANTRRAMVADLQIAPVEVDSVIRLIQSQLDLSLSPMLASREAPPKKHRD